MGSYPQKAIKEEPQPKYYDLQQMTEEWVYSLDSIAGKSPQRGRTKKDDYYLEYNYSNLKITDLEPEFAKRTPSLSSNAENIQYTTVIDEKTHVNDSSLKQSSTFNAQGDLETTFCAELSRALKVQDRCNVSFTLDWKKLEEHRRFAKNVQRRVLIEEVHDGKLKCETKDKLAWSASYPMDVKPYSSITAQLAVKVKEESLDFIHPMKLEGGIMVTLRRRGTGELVRSLEAKIHAVVDHFLKQHQGVEGFEVYNHYLNGYVIFKSKGTVKFSLGVDEHMIMRETDLQKEN